MNIQLKQIDETGIEITFVNSNGFITRECFHVDSPLSKITEKIKKIENSVEPTTFEEWALMYQEMINRTMKQ